MEDVEISYDIVQFNGSFYKEDIYRQDAGPEVDAAWEALGVNCRLFHRRRTSLRVLPATNTDPLPDRTAILPEALGPKSGLTKDHARRNAKYGGGYLVLVEGLHHLHCLVSVLVSFYFSQDFNDPADIYYYRIYSAKLCTTTTTIIIPLRK